MRGYVRYRVFLVICYLLSFMVLLASHSFSNEKVLLEHNVLSIFNSRIYNKKAELEPHADFNFLDKRFRIDLNGTWKFNIDLQNVGVFNRWFAPDYNDSEWDNIDVPSNWNYLFRGYNNPEHDNDYNGVGWYRKTFVVPENYNVKYIKIYFGAVCYKTTVWLNGEIVGDHEGDFIPFEFDVTDKIKFGKKNNITVRVESLNDNSINSVPPQPHKEGGYYDFWIYSGIYRDVYLEVADRINIYDLYINGKPEFGSDKAELSVEFTLANTNNFDDENEIEFLIFDKFGKLIKRLSYKVESPEQKYTTYKINTEINDAKLWNADSPYFYKCLAQLKKNGESIDAVGVNFGIRDIKIKNANIFINNKKTLLKGINRHDEHPLYGRAIPSEVYKKDFEYIKAANINALRTAHYPNNIKVYNLSDEMGFYVFEEIPVGKFISEDFYNEHVLNLASKYLKTMIYRDRNHPSIIIWSVGNEYHSESIGGEKYTKEIIDYAHFLDNSRLITFASDKELDDISMKYADIISINEYLGWYEGEITDLSHLLENLHIKYPEKPILISEYGADAIKNKRDYIYGYNAEHFTEDYQCYHLKYNWEVIKSKDFVSGGFIWIFADFLSSKRPYLKSKRTPKDTVINPVPYHNLKGILTEERIPKNAYLTVMGAYGNKNNYDLTINVVNKLEIPLNIVDVNLFCGKLLCGRQKTNLAGKTIFWSIPSKHYKMELLYNNRKITKNIDLTNNTEFKINFNE